MNEFRRARIGEIFVREGLVTPEQLDQIEREQAQSKIKTPIGELLVMKGLITDRDRTRCLAKYLMVDFVELDKVQIDQEVAQLVKIDFARKYRALPFARENGRIKVAMPKPQYEVIDQIKVLTGYDAELVLATEDDILSHINVVYDVAATAREDFQQLEARLATDEIEFKDERDTETFEVDLEVSTTDAETEQMARRILVEGLRQRASDIHIEPMKDRVRVRYRIDGIMREFFSFKKAIQNKLISVVKVMSNMDIANRRKPQDGRITTVFEGKEYDFRVNSLPSIHGEKIVLRILEKTSTAKSLSKLGFLPNNLAKVQDLIRRTNGIILVTGPTGSGKSTTLASILSELNTPEVNIVTIEDPVEYQIPGITQVQKNDAAGLTFAEGLRAFLRQDPDIIMVGEIRDRETATIACEAALTGHLVLSTLHTNDAPSTVTRLLDLDIEPVLIASSLAGVIAQRLVRQVCPYCKEEYEPPKEALRALGFNFQEGTSVVLTRGKGCPKCGGTGFSGRLGIHEVLVMDTELREMVLRRPSAQELREAAIRKGMTTLRDDVLEKIRFGLTTVDEALRVIYAGT